MAITRDFYGHPIGDMPTQVAIGNFRGIKGFLIQGQVNEAIAADGEILLWHERTPYTYPTSAIASTNSVGMASDSGSDTHGGIGAHSVVIEYLDTEYAQQTGVFSLNGTTPVNLPEEIFRVNAAYLQSAGSEGENEGHIRIGTGVFSDNGFPATTYEVIPKGYGHKSASGKYTVPASHSLLLSSPSITMDIFRTFMIEMYIKQHSSDIFIRDRAYFSSPTVSPNYDVPVVMSEKSELQWRVESMGAATDVLLNQSAGLIKNSFFNDQNMR